MKTWHVVFALVVLGCSAFFERALRAAKVLKL